MLKAFMSLIEHLNVRKSLLKLILICSTLFAQSFSNDERLEGFRQPVLTEQTRYETNKRTISWLLANQKILVPGHTEVVGQVII